MAGAGEKPARHPAEQNKHATGAVMALRSACNRDIVGSIPISGFRQRTDIPKRVHGLGGTGRVAGEIPAIIR